jgi:regulatory protein
MQFSLAVSNLVNLSVALQVPSLTARALRLLSTREHSRAELERKLQQFEEEPGALARVLDALAAKDFINDDRVVGSVLYRRAGKLGAARIKQELQAKGLAPERVTEAVANLRASELDRAREVWRKKFGTQPQDAAERAKQMRFLAGRGFGGDTIHRVVSGADED